MCMRYAWVLGWDRIREGPSAGFYAPYRRDVWGHPGYHPVMLLKALL